jgi:hypothetical protein
MNAGRIVVIGFAVLILAFGARVQAETENYGDLTLNPGYEATHFSDAWDLTEGDLTLNYQVDLSDVTQTAAGETPYIEVGMREVGAADFNPGVWNTYQGSKGGWMTSLVHDLATDPNNFDMDDKHNLTASGGRGEKDYDVYAVTRDKVEASPFGSFDSRGIWYDRDGVDPYQDTEAANTGGTYEIEISYHAINEGLGSMIAEINGNGTDWVDQEFRVSGSTYTGSTGLSFKGDMRQMQVFTGGWWTAGAGGDVVVSDISVTGEPTVALVEDGTASISVSENGTGGLGTAGLDGDAQILDTRIDVTDWNHAEGDDATYATLKMFYDEDELFSQGIKEQHLRMWWWDEDANGGEGEWVLGGTTIDGAQGESTFAGIGGPIEGLGYTGVNITDNYTWVNANHASDYIQATPEPGSAVLMAIGLLGLCLGGRRRRKG